MRTWLKKIRGKAHLTQNEVAKQSYITRQYYWAIEMEIRGAKLPVPTAKAIAKVLNFDWKRFYEDDAERGTPDESVKDPKLQH